PFQRSYLGGDNDIRGFDVRTISPVAFLPDLTAFPLLNPDGTPVPKDPTNPRQGFVTIPLPIYRITFPGGDTSMVSNVEYRIPLVGPVTLAIFADTGLNFALRSSQLKISNEQFTALNSAAFGCPTLDPAT